MTNNRVDDLIGKLRACANGIGSFKTSRGDFGLCDDAADEIEQLRADLDDALARASANLERAVEAEDALRLIRKNCKSAMVPSTASPDRRPS